MSIISSFIFNDYSYVRLNLPWMNYCVIPEWEGQIVKRKRKERVKWRQTMMIIMSSQERFVEDHQNAHVVFFLLTILILLFFLLNKYICMYISELIQLIISFILSSFYFSYQHLSFFLFYTQSSLLYYVVSKVYVILSAYTHAHHRHRQKRITV
jgi:hypothetical protein